jgi:hypothetical protein
MTDRLGRLLLVTLEAARVNADLPLLAALRSWLNSWRGIGDVERGMAAPGLRSPAHPVRRARLARHVLHDGDGALDHQRDRVSVGAHAVPRDAAGGVGGVEQVTEELTGVKTIPGADVHARSLFGSSAACNTGRVGRSRRRCDHGDLAQAPRRRRLDPEVTDLLRDLAESQSTLVSTGLDTHQCGIREAE